MRVQSDREQLTQPSHADANVSSGSSFAMCSITGNVGRFNQISVGLNPDVSPDQLRDRIERVVPPTLRVETAEQNANRSSDEIHDALSFLPIFLGVFAAVALIVGAFVIFNTFSITVSQRVREYGRRGVRLGSLGRC